MSENVIVKEMQNLTSSKLFLNISNGQTIKILIKVANFGRHKAFSRIVSSTLRP